MTISVREGRIALHFGNGWHAVKWDAAPPDRPHIPIETGSRRCKANSMDASSRPKP